MQPSLVTTARHPVAKKFSEGPSTAWGVQSGKSAFLLLPTLSASTGVSLPSDTVVWPLQLVLGLAWLLFLSGIFLPPGFMRQ